MKDRLKEAAELIGLFFLAVFVTPLWFFGNRDAIREEMDE